MVSNLLLVLCGERSAHPVVHTGCRKIEEEAAGIRLILCLEHPRIKVYYYRREVLYGASRFLSAFVNCIIIRRIIARPSYLMH
jgi:hypothetical protein